MKAIWGPNRARLPKLFPLSQQRRVLSSEPSPIFVFVVGGPYLQQIRFFRGGFVVLAMDAQCQFRFRS